MAGVGRILHILALIALVLSPLAMHRAEAAPVASHHAAAAEADCHGQPQRPDDHDRSTSADCAIACSAMPCIAEGIAAKDSVAPVYALAPAKAFVGTAPGSDPPPPRHA